MLKQAARLLIILSGCIVLFSAATASAQQASPVMACNGNMNVIRVSEIKPGMMPTFLKAVAAQTAWYKSKGSSDVIGVERVLEQNPSTKSYQISETSVITTHIETQKQPTQDDAYKAFVALFSSSSTIKTSYLTCLAK